MGWKTFDGVRFAAYSDDHPPPDVHGFYAGVEVVIDLILDERAVRLSARKSRIRPMNAKQSDINHVRETARKHFQQLVDLWEIAR